MSDTAALLGAHALIALVGLGLLPLLGVARTTAELLRRAGLAYLAGLAAVGILGATLAVAQIGVGVGWTAVLAAASLAAGATRLRRAPLALRRPHPVTAVALVAMAALLVQAWRTFAATPLLEYDAWAMWSHKGRALAELAGADPAVFAGAAYVPLHLDYPLLLPALEAIGFDATGGLEPRLAVFQFLLIGIAGVAALCSLLADRVRPELLWPVLLALAAAPALLGQLATAYADVPVALFGAAAATAGLRWLLKQERWALALAALFLAASGLTKGEGLVLAVAVLLALAGAGARPRPLGLLLAAVGAVQLPWLLYTLAHDVPRDDLVSRTLDVGWVAGRAGRGPIALQRLLEEALDPGRWGLLLPLALTAAVAAVVLRARREGVFLLVYAGVTLAALSWVYLVSPAAIGDYLDFSADRVVSGLVLGCAAVTPLALQALRDRPARGG